MAKKRTLFDDKPKEIQDLTYLIKQDIGNLHGEISKLQQVTPIRLALLLNRTI